MSSHTRSDWVDIAKALSITLVVMLYATFSVGEATGQIGALHWVVAFFTPLRMPEFFLISGLFLSRGIGRSWNQYADKRVLHYLYFYVLWSFLLCAFKFGIVDGDPLAALTNFVTLPFHPYSALWFIYALAIMGAAVKLLHEMRAPRWLGLGLAAVLNLLPIVTGYFIADYIAEYFFYFYAGYAFGPTIIVLVERLAANTTRAVLALMAWSTLNGALVFSGGFALLANDVVLGLAGLPWIRLPLAFAGALAVCTAAALLEKTSAKPLLRHVGQNTLPIFLAFLIPLAATREILLKIGIESPDVISLAAITSAIVLPLLLAELITRTGWGRFLFNRPSWAHVPAQANAAPAKVPAE